jgi:ribose transport system substrate-binding protein
MAKAGRDSYIVQAVVRASQILGVFESHAELLRLRDVVQRTGFGKGMCFRLLHTLSHCGLLEKVDATQYRLVSEIKRRKRYRVGYAAQGQESSFPREVHSGLQAAGRK